MRTKVKEVKDQLMRMMHLPIREVGRWLGSVVRGHLAYFAVPGNLDAIKAFRDQARYIWHQTLRRRSQRGQVTWEQMPRLIDRWLPKPRTRHPFPQQRFDAPDPSHEPSAVLPRAGICAGGRQ